MFGKDGVAFGDRGGGARPPIVPGADLMLLFPEDPPPPTGPTQDFSTRDHFLRDPEIAVPQPGTEHRYRVRALDEIGRASGWVTSAPRCSRSASPAAAGRAAERGRASRRPRPRARPRRARPDLRRPGAPRRERQHDRDRAHLGLDGRAARARSLGEGVPRLHEQRRRGAGARLRHGRHGPRRRPLRCRPGARARGNHRRRARRLPAGRRRIPDPRARRRHDDPGHRRDARARRGRQLPRAAARADRPPRPADRRAKQAGRVGRAARGRVHHLGRGVRARPARPASAERGRAADERLAGRQRRRRGAVRRRLAARRRAAGQRESARPVRCEARYHGRPELDVPPPIGDARGDDRHGDRRRRRARPRPAAVPRGHRLAAGETVVVEYSCRTATCSPRSRRRERRPRRAPPTAPPEADEAPIAVPNPGDRAESPPRSRASRSPSPTATSCSWQPGIRSRTGCSRRRAGRARARAAGAFSFPPGMRATSSAFAASTRPVTAPRARRPVRSSSACRRSRRSRRRTMSARAG